VTKPTGGTYLKKKDKKKLVKIDKIFLALLKRAIAILTLLTLLKDFTVN
jgi:hypothetical protein